jgi:hypothetical protein
MTTGEIFALAPTISPLIVLLVYMIQQSRKDTSSLSATWAGIAPDLLDGFREDLKLARAEAEDARRDAKEARKDADLARKQVADYQDSLLNLNREFHTYKMTSEAEIASLKRQGGIQ